jgi:hypothetical protein
VIARPQTADALGQVAEHEDANGLLAELGYAGQLPRAAKLAPIVILPKRL